MKLINFLLLMLLGLAATAQQQIPDGIYLVAATEGDTVSNDWYHGVTRTLNYDYRIVDSTSQSARLISVASEVYVPLSLEKIPDREIQEDLRSHLFLTLDRRASRLLKRMTRRYLQRRVALVVGGSVVTMHKIRTPITGNRLQITRCTDDACEFLFYELRDNVRR